MKKRIQYRKNPVKKLALYPTKIKFWEKLARKIAKRHTPCDFGLLVAQIVALADQVQKEERERIKKIIMKNYRKYPEACNAINEILNELTN